MQSEKNGGVYVSFFSSQPGKCRSVKAMCQWHIGSVGATCFAGGEPPERSECMHQAAFSPKCLHFGEAKNREE